jgi:competence CoiA-like predicted nuclease
MSEDNLIKLNKEKQQQIEKLKKDIQTKKYQSKYLRTDLRLSKCENRNLLLENKYYQKLINLLKEENIELYNELIESLVDDT